MIKKILKYINSIPFPLTIKNYQVFGDVTLKMKDAELNSLEAWEVLRDEHPNFSVPEERKEWLLVNEEVVKKDGQDKNLIKRAKEISEILKREKIDTIFSVAVGVAGLEYHIKKILPEINIVCSEYTPKSVDILKKVFIESKDVIKFDVTKDNWSYIKEKYLTQNSLCLIYRLDASFNDKEWRKIFENIYNSDIKNVLFIPTGVLTILSIINRKKREIKWFLNKTKFLFCGYIRTQSQFERYWQGLYNQEIFELGGLKSFLLKKK